MTIESIAADKTIQGQNDAPATADVRNKSLQPTALAPWVRFSVICALIAFAALTAIGIARTFTTVPRWDDWDGSLEFFANVSEGHWQAWFAQFAEQRPVLPRLFIWTDLKFFGGRFIFQHISGLGFAIALWLIFLLVTRALIKERALLFMIGAMITLLLSSWIQIPNFGVAFNGIHWFMVTFFALSTLIATARATDNHYAFYLAVFCGVAAAATLANGLIVLPLAAVLAYLIELGPTRSAILLVLGAILFVAYFTGYERPEIHGSPLTALADPIGIARYTLAYLGNVAFYIVFIAFAGADLAWKILAREGSVSLDKLNDHPLALAAGLTAAELAGAAMIVVTVILGWRWLKSDRNPLRGALIMFVIFVCGTACGTSLGRLSAFGIEQSIAARYTTTTIAALAALVILAAPYFSVKQVTVLFLSSVLLLLPRQLTALRSREVDHAQFERAMRAVIEHRETEDDRLLLGEPEIVQRVVDRLRAMKDPPYQWSH